MLFEYVICAMFLIAANYTDIIEYKIKNRTVLPVIAIGLILGVCNGNFSDCCFGTLIPLVLFPLYVLKMLGAGDIKAFCAIGAVVGLKNCLETMIFTFLCGGAIAVVLMIANKNLKKRFKNLFSWFRNCCYSRKIISYNFGGKEKSYFRFSYAITLGFVCMVVNNYFNIIII